MQPKYPNLLSSVRLGGAIFRNRYFSAPMGYEYLPAHNFPSDEAIAFFERKAVGGAATVNFGSAVADTKRACVGQTDLELDNPELLPALTRYASAVSVHGAVPVVELQHCGANAYFSAAKGNQIYGAFACQNSMGMEVPEMPEADILETIESYANAAAFAKHCGIGMITIHAGHGWLLNQFMSPENNRKDRWGGSVENRCRIVVAIIDRVHEMCGRGFPVDLRFSGTECWDGGYDISYGIELAKQLDGHADLLHVSVGCHERPEVFTITHPSMFLPDGANVKYAAEIKKHVKTPVGTVGALNHPQQMDEIIASGQADVVFAARQGLADPDFIIKTMTGREDEIRRCIRCFECFSCDTTKRQFVCAINPEIGRERETHFMYQHGAKFKKNILIAGGGIGGMQAALTAREKGHEVILCEKADLLGGVLRCEENVPFKKHLKDYLDQQARLVNRSGIEVRLGADVTADLAGRLHPDVIIAAVGAAPIVPMIQGIDGGASVIGPVDAYTHPEKLGKNITILGGGLVGIELAIYLSMLGRTCRIIEMANTLNCGGNVVHSLALSNELLKYGIEVITSTMVTEINSKGVVGEFVGDRFSLPPCPTVSRAVLQSNSLSRTIKGSAKEGERQEYEADAVVYAVGMRPRWEVAEALRFAAPEFYQLGDCTAARNIQRTTAEAFAIMSNIGRY